MAELRNMELRPWRPFYCQKLMCDGRPHGKDWDFPHGRWDQQPPKGDWLTWLIRGGRGSGKTRTGSEWTHRITKIAPRIALVAPTGPDARDTLVEGESGLLATAAPGERPEWEPSKKKLTWPNGAVAHAFSGEEPDRLRGPQHHCFVAGTIVQTSAGPMCIEDVTVGMEVWTRDGLRSVSATGSREARVVTRLGLTGTPDHPVWTENRGWVPLSDIHASDTLIAWIGERTSVGASMPTRKASSTGATAGSGSESEDRSQAAGKSITSIETPATTASRTSWRYLRRIIERFTGASRASSPAVGVTTSSFIPVSAGRLPLALPAPRSASARREGAQMPSGSRASGPASSAETSSSRALGDSAHPHASTDGEWETVFNLTVEGKPEFFANDILVHNCAWVDEPAHMPLIEDVWSNLLFGLRLGRHPRVCATTTPLPTEWMKSLVADPTTVSVAVSTYANIANLPPHYAKIILERYEGTRLGRQEIHGEILADVDGALWKYEYFDPFRVEVAPALDRIVVGIDPAGTSKKRSNETGIIVVGIAGDEFYVLADYSGKYSPKGWADRAMAAYRDFNADAIVVETNYGGEMVRSTLESVDESPRIIEVNSRRGKVIRADPIVALYEKERVHHVGKSLGVLEDQLVSWVPTDESPDRLDALVHAMHDLAKTSDPASVADPRALRAMLSSRRPGVPNLTVVRRTG